MSGLSNVVHWLEERDYQPEDELVQAIFQRAKQADAMLEEAEVEAICREHGAVPA